MKVLTTVLTIVSVLKVPTALSAKQKHYYIHNEPETFNDAAEVCKREQMKLAELINFGYQTDYMADLSRKNATDVRYWVGARKNDQEWTWQRSGIKFSNYQFWAPEHPKPSEENKNCLSTSETDLQWMDDDCDQKLQYVCEHPI